MSRLLPYETIVKAHEGDPEAVDAVLSHYAGYIRYFSKMNGQVNAEVEDYVKEGLKKIYCFFLFYFRPFCPLPVAVVSEKKNSLPRQLPKSCCPDYRSKRKFEKIPVQRVDDGL